MSESIEPGIIRLERSRSALFEYLRANERPATRANDGVSGYAEAVGGADLSGVASAVFQGWWQQHPVRVGLNAAWGLIEGEVRRHPLRAPLRHAPDHRRELRDGHPDHRVGDPGDGGERGRFFLAGTIVDPLACGHSALWLQTLRALLFSEAGFVRLPRADSPADSPSSNRGWMLRISHPAALHTHHATHHRNRGVGGGGGGK